MTNQNVILDEKTIKQKEKEMRIMRQNEKIAEVLATIYTDGKTIGLALAVFVIIKQLKAYI